MLVSVLLMSQLTIRSLNGCALAAAMLQASMPANAKMPFIMQRDMRLLPPEKTCGGAPKRKKGGCFFKRLLPVGLHGL